MEQVVKDEDFYWRYETKKKQYDDKEESLNWGSCGPNQLLLTLPLQPVM